MGCGGSTRRIQCPKDLESGKEATLSLELLVMVNIDPPSSLPTVTESLEVDNLPNKKCRCGQVLTTEVTLEDFRYDGWAETERQTSSRAEKSGPSTKSPLLPVMLPVLPVRDSGYTYQKSRGASSRRAVELTLPMKAGLLKISECDSQKEFSLSRKNNLRSKSRLLGSRSSALFSACQPDLFPSSRWIDTSPIHRRPLEPRKDKTRHRTIIEPVGEPEASPESESGRHQQMSGQKQLAQDKGTWAQALQVPRVAVLAAEAGHESDSKDSAKRITGRLQTPSKHMNPRRSF